MSPRLLRIVLLGSALTAASACVLNPQPIPPADDDGTASGDDDGLQNPNPPANVADAGDKGSGSSGGSSSSSGGTSSGGPGLEDDAGDADAGDAGEPDAGDAGDADNADAGSDAG